MPEPRVQLPQGTVVGSISHECYPHAVEAFKGVPYALPPTGERRFRPPEKVGKSQEIIDATKFGPRAPAQQFITIGPTLEESEGCLTVNVFRQARHNQSRALPVAVYFHGGAFNRGNAAMHDTASMVGWSELPFIAVSFGYRIGALGFLPSKLSAKEGALNLGLKDQICLLDWVEDNIEHFGGDKDNVTLIGLSAGAHSVCVVLTILLSERSTYSGVDRSPFTRLQGGQSAQVPSCHYRIRSPNIPRSPKARCRDP